MSHRIQLLEKVFKKSPLVFIVLVLILGNVECEKDSKIVVDADPSEMQRISILVGRAGETETEDSTGEPGSDDGESAGAPPVKSTGFDASCAEGRCCFQFTWQGYIPEDEIPAPANATCKYLQDDRKDTSFACFDPIVYTEKTSNAKDRVGSPPDIKQLASMADENDWNIYCPLTNDKTCLTFKYYSRGGGEGKQIINETRFCGSIVETNTGGRITSGCYTEEVQGGIKEVCACRDQNLCNSGVKMQLHLALLALVLLVYNIRLY